MAERRNIGWPLRTCLAGDALGSRGGKSQLAALDQLADAEHTSRAELIREAIDLLLTRLKRPKL